MSQAIAETAYAGYLDFERIVIHPLDYEESKRRALYAALEALGIMFEYERY